MSPKPSAARFTLVVDASHEVTPYELARWFCGAAEALEELAAKREQRARPATPRVSPRIESTLADLSTWAKAVRLRPRSARAKRDFFISGELGDVNFHTRVQTTTAGATVLIGAASRVTVQRRRSPRSKSAQ